MSPQIRRETNSSGGTMRFQRILGIFLLLVGVVAVAKDNKLGIREVSRVRFDSVIHIGSTVVPAGEYVVRHTMEGQDHIMVFKRDGKKDEFKVKCTLVPLAKNAPRDETTYQVTGGEKILQELVFKGDSAKHVF
jgi:hypothetical protein